ncbi:hypothetical protein BpHYR1_009070, partial [Brachionus plicatilis]
YICEISVNNAILKAQHRATRLVPELVDFEYSHQLSRLELTRDLTTVSIFIALSTTSVSPLLTMSPSLHLTSMTVPGMGAPMDPLRPLTAFGCAFKSFCTDLSLTSNDLN